MKQLQQGRVLVVGDVMLDRYWFGDVERISPEAPVPVVHVKRNDERLGGAANVARNVAALGAQVALMGTVGDDEAGWLVGTLLEQENIQSHIYVDNDISTTVKLRVIGRTQQLLRVDFEEAPSKDALLSHLEEFTTLVKNYDAVVFSDYGKGGLSHIVQMMEIAQQAQVKVLVDPKGTDWERYRGANIITPNRSEFRAVVGAWNSEAQFTEKAQALRQQFDFKALLVTRSEDGMTLYQHDERFHVPTVAREVFDVSGAGDTVIATLAAAMAAHLPLNEAVQLANRAAGIVVGKLGTATVTYQELFA